MSSSLPNAARVTEGQKVAPNYLPLVGAVPPSDAQVSADKSVTGVDLCELLAAAIDATGARKEAAADMGISAPVLTKQLQGTDGASPSLKRVGQLKRDTLIAFANKVLAACEQGDPKVARQEAVEEAARAFGKLVALAMSA